MIFLESHSPRTSPNLLHHHKGSLSGPSIIYLGSKFHLSQGLDSSFLNQHRWLWASDTSQDQRLDCWCYVLQGSAHISNDLHQREETEPITMKKGK